MICVAAVTRGNLERFSPSYLKAGAILSSLLQLLNQGLKKHSHVPTAVFWCNGVWISRPEGNSALGTVTGQGLCNASGCKTELKWGLCFAAASHSATSQGYVQLCCRPSGRAKPKKQQSSKQESSRYKHKDSLAPLCSPYTRSGSILLPCFVRRGLD